MSNPAPAIAGQQPERRANAPAQQQGGPVERVEARISDLHAKLQITPAQEPQKAYADVMRSNAQSMQNLLQQQPQNTGMTAVDVLRSYERLTTTHAEALNKLVPAFEALYATLSAEQKNF